MYYNQNYVLRPNYILFTRIVIRACILLILIFIHLTFILVLILILYLIPVLTYVRAYLQVWSNNEYKAPEHRVRASLEKKRYSSPFFYNPNYEINVSPFITEKSLLKEAIYNPINYGNFRLRRFQGDYADTGKEIQIEDFIRTATVSV